MRSAKGSHRIVVDGVEYRWRATGNDGWISVGIWPTNTVGAFICGTFRYHEHHSEDKDGVRQSLGNQIIITNRITRRIIELAALKHAYDPNVKADQLNLGHLDDQIKWDDAIRGVRW
jgi:hypothetical protein